MTKSKMKEYISKNLDSSDRDTREFLLEVDKMIDFNNSINNMTVKQIEWVLNKCLEFIGKWKNTNPDSKYWLTVIDEAEKINNLSKGNELTKKLLFISMLAIDREKRRNDT